MGLLDLFTKKWAKRKASQMLDVYMNNKKYLANLSDKEILQKTLLGAPEKNVAKIVLDDKNLWEEGNFTKNQIVLMYIIELWKLYFKTEFVPENKKIAIENGVNEAIKNYR